MSRLVARRKEREKNETRNHCTTTGGTNIHYLEIYGDDDNGEEARESLRSASRISFLSFFAGNTAVLSRSDFIRAQKSSDKHAARTKIPSGACREPAAICVQFFSAKGSSLSTKIY